MIVYSYFCGFALSGVVLQYVSEWPYWPYDKFRWQLCETLNSFVYQH